MILSALDLITGADGTDRGKQRYAILQFLDLLIFSSTDSLLRITSLRENSNFFRNRLKELGFRVAGDEDSPVIPLMLYHPAKIAAFSRLCLLENVSDWS